MNSFWLHCHKTNKNPLSYFLQSIESSQRKCLDYFLDITLIRYYGSCTVNYSGLIPPSHPFNPFPSIGFSPNEEYRPPYQYLYGQPWDVLLQGYLKFFLCLESTLEKKFDSRVSCKLNSWRLNHGCIYNSGVNKWIQVFSTILAPLAVQTRKKVIFVPKLIFSVKKCPQIPISQKLIKVP